MYIGSKTTFLIPGYTYIGSKTTFLISGYMYIGSKATFLIPGYMYIRSKQLFSSQAICTLGRKQQDRQQRAVRRLYNATHPKRETTTTESILTNVKLQHYAIVKQ